VHTERDYPFKEAEWVVLVRQNERIIERGVALLMDHFDLDDGWALGVLRRLAQSAGVPIDEVAQKLVERDKLGQITGRENLLAEYLSNNM
jgi:hypothetical protein